MILPRPTAALGAALALPLLVAGHAIKPRAATTLPLNTDPSQLRGACGEAADAAAAFFERNPDQQIARLLPSVGARCLLSIPVDTPNNVAMIDHVLPYVEFESTLGYLKNPPKGRLIPGVDVKAGLETIKSRLNAGQYMNQYQFTTDFATVFRAAGEGHLSFPLALNTAFVFVRGVRLVSLSSDGVSLPNIYSRADVVKSSMEGYQPSPVESIDGVPIMQFLTDVAFVASSQDPDAKFNNLFTNPALAAVVGGETQYDLFSAGGQRMVPDTHTVKYTNGSSEVVRNEVAVTVNLTGITEGSELHARIEKTETGGTLAAMATQFKMHLMQRHHEEDMKLRRRQMTTPPKGPVVPYGYPKSPVAIHYTGSMFGYAGDTACVLTLYSFTNVTKFVQPPNYNTASDTAETRRVANAVINACKARGLDKLIIDVSANGGGSLFAAHELYRVLFPKGKNFSGGNHRVSAVLKWLGAVFFDNTAYDGVFGHFFGAYLGADGNRFPSWEAMFGPRGGYPADNLTNIGLYDFNDPRIVSTEASIPFLLTGYGPDAAASPPAQPFAAENIVIVTDGICASACTIFTSLMTREAGVRTIAMGGRPLAAPMQAMGGTKGNRLMPVSDIRAALSRLPANATQISPLPQGVTLPSLNKAPLQPHDLAGASVNWRNAYLAYDPAGPPGTEGHPLQFVYEAAHCRRFYRLQHLDDASAQWDDAYAVVWGGAKCAPGSSTGPDGTIGATAPPFSEAVLSTATYTGPGAVNNGISGGVDLAFTPGANTPGNGKKSAAAGLERRSLLGLVVAGVVAAAMLV